MAAHLAAYSANSSSHMVSRVLWISDFASTFASAGRRIVRSRLAFVDRRDASEQLSNKTYTLQLECGSELEGGSDLCMLSITNTHVFLPCAQLPAIRLMLFNGAKEGRANHEPLMQVIAPQLSSGDYCCV